MNWLEADSAEFHGTAPKTEGETSTTKRDRSVGGVNLPPTCEDMEQEMQNTKDSRQRKVRRNHEQEGLAVLEEDVRHARTLHESHVHQTRADKERDHVCAQRLAIRDRRLAREVLLSMFRCMKKGGHAVIGQMWKLGRSWETGGVVRLWYKRYFVLKGATLHYCRSREALLHHCRDSGLSAGQAQSDDFSSPGDSAAMLNTSPAPTTSRSTPVLTPRSLMSVLTPRSLASASSTPRSRGGSHAASSAKTIPLLNAVFNQIDGNQQQSSCWRFSIQDHSGREHQFACSSEQVRSNWMVLLKRAATLGSVQDVDALGGLCIQKMIDVAHICTDVDLPEKKDTPEASRPPDTIYQVTVPSSCGIEENEVGGEEDRQWKELHKQEYSPRKTALKGTDERQTEVQERDDFTWTRSQGQNSGQFTWSEGAGSTRAEEEDHEATMSIAPVASHSQTPKATQRQTGDGTQTEGYGQDECTIVSQGHDADQVIGSSEATASNHTPGQDNDGTMSTVPVAFHSHTTTSMVNGDEMSSSGAIKVAVQDILFPELSDTDSDAYEQSVGSKDEVRIDDHDQAAADEQQIRTSSSSSGLTYDVPVLPPHKLLEKGMTNGKGEHQGEVDNVRWHVRQSAGEIIAALSDPPKRAIPGCPAQAATLSSSSSHSVLTHAVAPSTLGDFSESEPGMDERQETTTQREKNKSEVPANLSSEPASKAGERPQPIKDEASAGRFIRIKCAPRRFEAEVEEETLCSPGSDIATFVPPLQADPALACKRTFMLNSPFLTDTSSQGDTTTVWEHSETSKSARSISAIEMSTSAPVFPSVKRDRSVTFKNEPTSKLLNVSAGNWLALHSKSKSSDSGQSDSRSRSSNWLRNAGQIPGLEAEDMNTKMCASKDPHGLATRDTFSTSKIQSNIQKSDVQGQLRELMNTLTLDSLGCDSNRDSGARLETRRKPEANEPTFVLATKASSFPAFTRSGLVEAVSSEAHTSNHMAYMPNVQDTDQTLNDNLGERFGVMMINQLNNSPFKNSIKKELKGKAKSSQPRAAESPNVPCSSLKAPISSSNPQGHDSQERPRILDLDLVEVLPINESPSQPVHNQALSSEEGCTSENKDSMVEGLKEVDESDHHAMNATNASSVQVRSTLTPTTPPAAPRAPLAPRVGVRTWATGAMPSKEQS